MLTPDYLLRITEGAERIAEELHNYVIAKVVERIMERIGRGEELLLSSTDRYQLINLMEHGYMVDELQGVIAKYTKLQKDELRQAFEDAGITALDYDNEVYIKAGLSPLPLRQSPQLVRLLQASYDTTMGTWKNYTNTLANNSVLAYTRAVDKAYMLTSSGVESYNVAVADAIQELGEQGIPTIQYPSGKSENIEVAVARAVRTGVTQATAKVSEERMNEYHWDIVLTSAHMGARIGDGGENPSNHAWWQGRFFTRYGENPQFPDFVKSTGYGTGEGLCGWNCRHSFGAGDGVFNPYEGLIDKEENKKYYEKTQRQRALERRIRKLKREVNALEVAMDSCTDEQAKFELSQRLEREKARLLDANVEYRDFCLNNKLKPQEVRLKVPYPKRMEEYKNV